LLHNIEKAHRLLQFDLAGQLENNGIINPQNFSVKVNITPISTTDPEIIEVEYQSLFDEESYIKRKVIVEGTTANIRKIF
jgi:hypothetical protein